MLILFSLKNPLFSVFLESAKEIGVDFGIDSVDLKNESVVKITPQINQSVEIEWGLTLLGLPLFLMRI